MQGSVSGERAASRGTWRGRMTGSPWGAALLCLIGAGGAAARGADNRFILLQQDSWENHRGFYVDLENNGTRDPGATAAASATPFSVGTLRLAMGVGDGSQWHFLGATPPWQLGHVYHLSAVIDSTHSTLSLDGQPLASMDHAALAPNAGVTEVNQVPDWANGPSDYTVVERSAQVTADGHSLLQQNWPSAEGTNAAQRLFSPQPAWSTPDLRLQPGQHVVVSVAFSVESQQRDLHALAPIIDRFGQDRYGQWPTKVTSDAQLASDTGDEQRRLAAMPALAGLDVYGGSTAPGWSEHGTGFYHTVRHGGVWWLITPTGLPCFYTGMCNAPLVVGNGTPVKGRESLFAELPDQHGRCAPAWSGSPWGEADNVYFCFDTANLIRKFGPSGWREAAQTACTQRLGAFGFTGLGKWSNPYGGLPYAVVLSHPDDPKSGKGKLDVFDPAARERFRSTIAAQIAPHRNDPLLLGWSVGNEMDEIVRTDEIVAMLSAPTATPAKVAMVANAIDTIYGHDPAKFAAAWHASGSSPEQLAAAPLIAPPADVEPLRHFYAAAYYRFIDQTVKSLDPNHLYFGFWIVPGWWMNVSDWGLIARYCDVIGYDHYDPSFADAHLQGLMKQTDKPVLCGEFSFPPTYQGARGVGTYTQANATDDADAGRHYAAWLHDAARNPYCVGTMWFEYRDEPITGRGPGSGPNLIYDEHYAFGIVDVTDRVKWDLVTAMRTANLAATTDRQASSVGDR